MKTRIFLVMIVIISCEIEQEVIDPTHELLALPLPTTSLQAVRERVLQSERGYVKFSQEEDSLWVTAFVTSSDEGGKFLQRTVCSRSSFPARSCFENSHGPHLTR